MTCLIRSSSCTSSSYSSVRHFCSMCASCFEVLPVCVIEEPCSASDGLHVVEKTDSASVRQDMFPKTSYLAKMPKHAPRAAAQELSPHEQHKKSWSPRTWSCTSRERMRGLVADFRRACLDQERNPHCKWVTRAASSVESVLSLLKRLVPLHQPQFDCPPSGQSHEGMGCASPNVSNTPV